MRQAENKKALDLFPVSHSHIKTSSDIQLLGLFFYCQVCFRQIHVNAKMGTLPF